MALGDPYVSLDDAREYVGAKDDRYDEFITGAIASISTEINNYCGRQFNDAGAASARWFYPVSRGLCFVDDFHTAVGVVVAVDDDGDGVAETTWALADYELQPLNGVVNGVPGWPYTSIRPRSGVRFGGPLSLTARWGWAAVPAPVTEAAKLLVKDTYAARETRFGVAGFGQFGDIRVRDNNLAAAKLRDYVRTPIKVG